MRRHPRAIFATGWHRALGRLPLIRSFCLRTVRKQPDRGPAGKTTKTGPRSRRWTRRSVVIPAAIIILLGAGLTGRNAIYQWVDWNYRTENPHAILIPDGSDVIVTVDLARMRDQNARDAINGWRHRATTNSDADDIAIALSDWTGREFADAEIEPWVGRRLTMFTGHWGSGVLIETREPATATTWLENGDDDQWTGWVSEERVWLAQNAETESAIRETNAHGQRTSASAGSDYRRASEAHTMKGAQVEIFARWRAVPEPWRERLTTVMDCAPSKWVSSRVRADESGLQAETICPAPQRQWRPRTLEETSVTASLESASGDLWLITSHRTSWPEIIDRIENTSPPTAELARAIQNALGEGEPGLSGLLAQSAGVTAVTWRHRPEGWSVIAQLRAGTKAEAAQRLDTLAAEIAGKWGAEAATTNEDGSHTIAHPLWGGNKITVGVNDEAIVFNEQAEVVAGDNRELARAAITQAGWTVRGATAVGKWAGEPLGAWIATMGSGTAWRTSEAGLNFHRLVTSWEE